MTSSRTDPEATVRHTRWAAIGDQVAGSAATVSEQAVLGAAGELIDALTPSSDVTLWTRFQNASADAAVSKLRSAVGALRAERGAPVSADPRVGDRTTVDGEDVEVVSAYEDLVALRDSGGRVQVVALSDYWSLTRAVAA